MLRSNDIERLCSGETYSLTILTLTPIIQADSVITMYHQHLKRHRDMAPHFLERAVAPPAANPDDSHVTRILAVTCALTGLTLFVNLLRFYVRSVMLKHMGVDDWVMVFVSVGLFPRSVDLS